MADHLPADEHFKVGEVRAVWLTPYLERRATILRIDSARGDVLVEFADKVQEWVRHDKVS
jgi:hypothetical protein